MVRARFLIDLKTLVSRFVFGALRLPSPVPHRPTCSPRPPPPARGEDDEHVSCGI